MRLLAEWSIDVFECLCVEIIYDRWDGHSIEENRIYVIRKIERRE